jgi:undecaprenyl-diphosphatase
LEKTKPTIVTAAFALLLFTWLAYLVSAGQVAGFDSSVRQTVHEWSSPWFTRLMLAATFVGTTGFMSVLGVFFVWRLIDTGRRREAFLFMAVAVGAYPLLQILKLSFHRPRPEPFFDLPVPGSFSFPSGHALLSTVFYIALTTLLTRSVAIRAAAVALVLAIGFSRVYLGVHYPSDVLGGYAAAVAWLWGFRTQSGLSPLQFSKSPAPAPSSDRPKI